LVQHHIWILFEATKVHLQIEAQKRKTNSSPWTPSKFYLLTSAIPGIGLRYINIATILSEFFNSASPFP
jgi:hypothetical protein